MIGSGKHLFWKYVDFVVTEVTLQYYSHDVTLPNDVCLILSLSNLLVVYIVEFS